MWDWLFFWKRSGKPPQEQSATPPAASTEPLQTGTGLPPEPNTRNPEQAPVVVRGKAWKNTTADPQGSLPQPETQPALGIPDLIQRLRHKESTVRRSGAEVLGGLGARAREAIPALLIAACDIDAAVRKVAATALDQVDVGWPTDPGARDAVPNLIQEMKRRSSDIVQTASLLLSRIGRSAVPELARALTEGTSDIHRVFVARTLERIGPEAAPAVPALAQALTSEFAHVRESAADALSAIGEASEPAVPALVLLLADWHAGVRRASCKALARVGRAAELAVTGLIQLLADRDDEVREAAVEALAQAGPSSVPLLLELLQLLDSRQLEAWLRQKVMAADWYANAAEHLAQGGVVQISYRRGDRVIDEIQREPLKALRNLGWCFQQAVEDHLRMETAREAAIRVLGKLGPTACAAVPLVIEALVDKNRRVRAAAVRSLSQMGPSARAACPALARSLADTNETVRKAAAEALTKIDPDWASDNGIRDAVEALVERLKQSGDAGQTAAEALVCIGSSCVPVLVNALAAEDRILREAAATTLGRIGAQAQSAIPALVSALQDGSGFVREAAAQALQKIDPHGLQSRSE
jgi:HEAT repeat protein